MGNCDFGWGRKVAADWMSFRYACGQVCPQRAWRKQAVENLFHGYWQLPCDREGRKLPKELRTVIPGQWPVKTDPD